MQKNTKVSKRNNRMKRNKKTKHVYYVVLTNNLDLNKQQTKKLRKTRIQKLYYLKIVARSFPCSFHIFVFYLLQTISPQVDFNPIDFLPSSFTHVRYIPKPFAFESKQ